MDYKEIDFNEEEHRYFDDTDKKYISVTTLIGKYTTKFDTEYWSMYTALKDRHYKVKANPEKQTIMIAGVEYKLKDLIRDKTFLAFQNLTKAKWAATTAEACMKGTATHNKLEDNINTSKINYNEASNMVIAPNIKQTISTIHDLDRTNLKEEYPLIYDRFSRYIERGASIFAEKRVHLEEEGIAGMIDVPIFKGLNFCIDDWKTNKDEIHRLAGYYKKVKKGYEWVKSDEFVATGEKFNYPIQHLEASTFNKYAMQLSVYAYILERWGYKLVGNGLNLIHIREGHETKIINLPYLKQEVQLMIKHYTEVA